MRRTEPGRVALLAAFGLLVAAIAASRIGSGVSAEIWDDALFSRRVAYNVLHHGVAAWNRVDGPVFVNTSQLHQAIATVLLAIAPSHFNAATVIWGAGCTFATFVLLRGRGFVEDAILFVALSAPPVLMAIGTGMDTCTVFVVLAAFLRVALGAPSRPKPAVLAALNALVALARPDAALLSTAISIGVLTAPAPASERRRRLVAFAVVFASSLVVLGGGFYAYYGSALPLATFLKLDPVSIYDRAYIALGRADKLANLLQVGLAFLALAPFVAMRLDRENVALVGGALAFAGFHAATTNEIMGYHARFYAPGLPVLACAAVRGVSHVDAPRRKRTVVLAAGVAGALALLAYDRGWIETAARGSYLDRTPLVLYVLFFAGAPIFGLLLPSRDRRAELVGASLAIASAVLVTAAMLPRPFSVATDRAIYERAALGDDDLVGIATIAACFEEPFQLTHSELGLPGVLFPESRIIDLSGLANPSIVNRRFDFERLCRADRPEVVFRPHRSHRGLNAEMSRSDCLASGYTAVKLPRPSACPLFVRNDLVGRFDACADAGRR